MSDSTPRKKLTLKEAREQNRLADFIEQHSDELADDDEFVKLLERMERDEKLRQSGYQDS